MLCAVRLDRRLPDVRGAAGREDEEGMTDEVKVAGISVKMERSDLD